MSGYTQSQVIEAIQITAEICGGEISQTAAKAMVLHLKPYGADRVMAALTKCQIEVKGRVALKDIIERVNADDGRPNADEAWGLIAGSLEDERESMVWTDEMAQASAAAQELIKTHDRTGARMAFRAAYERLCKEARERHKPVRWSLSPGSDVSLRAAVIITAVEAGKLPKQQAVELLPYQSDDERHLLLTGQVMTPEERRIGRQNVQKLLAMIPVKTMDDEK